ncbi:MAG TPA: DinB family protein [Candidatus Methylomirabilis sp.]|nr:DinB family protein [Candidatus Methylomirabilis sp.]
MTVQLIRELYDYHRWANRRLFDLAIGLGEGATRDMGKHWSVPTVKGMLTHIYGADATWLSRWKGSSPPRLLGDADFPTLRDLRPAWDAFEAEQRGFVEGLSEADLARPVTYKNTVGELFTVALGPLLQHVVNHATHHRSEIATMITLISASPPDTGLNTYRTTVVKG